MGSRSTADGSTSRSGGAPQPAPERQRSVMAAFDRTGDAGRAIGVEIVATQAERTGLGIAVEPPARGIDKTEHVFPHAAEQEA